MAIITSTGIQGTGSIVPGGGGSVPTYGTPTPTVTPTQSPTPSTPPTMYTPPAVDPNALQPLPGNFYDSARTAIQNGTMSPQEAQQFLQSYITGGHYGGSVDTNKLFNGLSIQRDGMTYSVNPDGSLKQISGTMINNRVGGYGTTTTTSPASDPSKTSTASTATAPAASTPSTPGVTTPPPASSPQPLNSSLPGGNATTLYDYYAAKGQTLPSVTDRGAIFAQLGLGTAAEYTGSAMQNEEMLSALQRQDYSNSTIGTQTGAANSGAATNSTPAGMSLASVLSGGDASTTLDNYKTYLSTALGVASDKLSSDENSLNSFFNNEEDPTSILQDAMDSAGVSQSQNILADLDKQIASQQKTLDDLPDAIRTSLADVGVSQAQLTRLTAKETAAPTKALKDLLTQRNATSAEIDKAMSFAEKFANTKIAAQASRLAALEWQVTNDRTQYNNLDADAKTVITSAINEKKDILDTALTAAKNGAHADTIDAILNSGSAAEAIQHAGPTLVKPKKTPANTNMGNDIKSLASAFDVGIPGKGYNGVGPDGYVDNHLYVAAYNNALQQYGSAGAAAFLKAYPPTGGGSFTKGTKGVNPANIGTGLLPPAIENLLLAGQKTQKVTSIK